MSHEKRRLPIYILLDRTALLTPDAAQAVRGAIEDLLEQLSRGLHGLPPERIAVSFIAFDRSARQLKPLTRVLDLVPPDIRLCQTPQPAGAAALGEALQTLHECLCRDVRPPTPERPGDWTPLVILVSNGEAADAWEDALGRLARGPRPTVLACASSPRPNLGVLKRVAHDVTCLAQRPAQARLRVRLWPRAGWAWATPCPRCGRPNAEPVACGACGARVCSGCWRAVTRGPGSFTCPQCGTSHRAAPCHSQGGIWIEP